jgi:hypothetical protein
MKKTATITVIVLCAYVAFYGAVRWRKLLIWTDYNRKTGVREQPCVGVGRDVRENWIGQTKNAMAPWAFWLSYPLVCCENALRGKQRVQD